MVVINIFRQFKPDAKDIDLQKEESSSLLVANIFKSNYIIQENDLIKTIPTSPIFFPIWPIL